MIADFSPQVFDVDVNIVRHGEGVKSFTPNVLGHVEAGDGSITVVEKEFQEEKFFRSEIDRLVIVSDDSGVGVNEL
jgi:hypothetical protein